MRCAFCKRNWPCRRNKACRLLDRQQEELPSGLIQIHGTADKVLPSYERPGIIKIPQREHLMILHRPDEISAILSKILEQP